MADVLEIFADTGVVIERDFTPEENEQRVKDQEENARLAAEKAKEKTAKSKIRLAALQHAKSLGFSDEMIAVMYPSLMEE